MGMTLDSCVWVGLASNQGDRPAVLVATGTSPVFISVISLGELSFGVDFCLDPTERTMRASYLRQLESLPTIDVTKQTATSC